MGTTVQMAPRRQASLAISLLVSAVSLGFVGVAAGDDRAGATGRYDWTGALSEHERFTFAPGLNGSRANDRAPPLSPASGLPSVVSRNSPPAPARPNTNPYAPTTGRETREDPLPTPDTSGQDFDGATTAAASHTVKEAAPPLVPDLPATPSYTEASDLVEPSGGPQTLAADRATQATNETSTASAPSTDDPPTLTRAPVTASQALIPNPRVDEAPEAAPPPTRTRRALGGPPGQAQTSRRRAGSTAPTAPDEPSEFDGWFEPTPPWARRAFQRP